MKYKEAWDWIVEFHPYSALDENARYFYGAYHTEDEAEAAIYGAKTTKPNDIFYLYRVETKITYTKTFFPLDKSQRT